jgi:hypothetical protein
MAIVVIAHGPWLLAMRGMPEDSISRLTQSRAVRGFWSSGSCWMSRPATSPTAQLSIRQDQDRSVVHPRYRRQGRIRCDRSGGHEPREPAQHGDHGRRRRDRSPAADDPRPGLHRDAGLSVQSAGPRRGAGSAVGGQPRSSWVRCVAPGAAADPERVPIGMDQGATGCLAQDRVGGRKVEPAHPVKNQHFRAGPAEIIALRSRDFCGYPVFRSRFANRQPVSRNPAPHPQSSLDTGTNVSATRQGLAPLDRRSPQRRARQFCGMPVSIVG